ncbi:MAG: KpsF/GutQ family sugar-phosphate isomerase [Pseudomonadota bacterium]
METGRRVLSTEAAALTQLGLSLDDNFADAVDRIMAVRGRVILSGMGKSGHIARKTAATFASTGTPAQFVHPAEASHGDLGMVTAEDLCIVLSNSGETRELADIVGHTRRFGIPLIGIASRRDSTLLRAADVPLTLPPAPEACSVGLAPTTSTTLALALGDALAVAVMERRNFTPDHYRIFHPGGTLGAQLLQVSSLMHTGAALPLVERGTAMPDALVEMSSKGFGIVGVVDEAGHLDGVITDGDLRRKMDGLLDRTAGDVATRNPQTIQADALAAEALAAMNAPPRPTLCLFVFGSEGDQRPIGIIHIHDCLRAGVDSG